MEDDFSGGFCIQVLSLRMCCVLSSWEEDSFCKMCLARCLWSRERHHHLPTAQARDSKATGHLPLLGLARPSLSQTLASLPPKCFSISPFLSTPNATAPPGLLSGDRWEPLLVPASALGSSTRWSTSPQASFLKADLITPLLCSKPFHSSPELPGESPNFLTRLLVMELLLPSLASPQSHHCQPACMLSHTSAKHSPLWPFPCCSFYSEHSSIPFQTPFTPMWSSSISADTFH